MHTDAHRLNQISQAIIGCAYRVLNELGCGFVEKVYENALAHDCRKAGLLVEQQVRFVIYYDGVEVGEYVADLVIERAVLVETKTVKAFDEIHIAQTINELKASGLHVALLLNFAKTKLEIKRFVDKHFRELDSDSSSV